MRIFFSSTNKSALVWISIARPSLDNVFSLKARGWGKMINTPAKKTTPRLELLKSDLNLSQGHYLEEPDRSGHKYSFSETFVFLNLNYSSSPPTNLLPDASCTDSHPGKETNLAWSCVQLNSVMYQLCAGLTILAKRPTDKGYEYE